MQRTAIRLGGIDLASSIMNASGARSAERGEIYELTAVHSGPIVFKSCNASGLDTPENLKNRGASHFGELAKELSARGKIVIGSVVGTSEQEFVVVAKALDSAGAKIIELNLADDYVLNSLAPFASFERLKALLGMVRAEVGAVMAVKMPAKIERERTRSYADLLKSLRIAIAVCHNDLGKGAEIDLALATIKGPKRPLSQAHAFFMESDQLLDVVAVGGISSGRDAYLAHLLGAKGLQVGSALMKEGPGALGRIDRELDTLLAENGKRRLTEIVGAARFI